MADSACRVLELIAKELFPLGVTHRVAALLDFYLFSLQKICGRIQHSHTIIMHFDTQTSLGKEPNLTNYTRNKCVVEPFVEWLQVDQSVLL